VRAAKDLGFDFNKNASEKIGVVHQYVRKQAALSTDKQHSGRQCSSPSTPQTIQQMDYPNPEPTLFVEEPEPLQYEFCYFKPGYTESLDK